MNKSESESVLNDPKFVVLDNCIGNLVWELHNGGVDMCKLEEKVHKVQEEHQKRLARFLKTMSESEQKALKHLEYNDANMRKLAGKVREVQEKTRKIS